MIETQDMLRKHCRVYYGVDSTNVNYSSLEIPVILLGLPGPGSNGFLTKGALEGICRLVLKVTVFAHSMFAWKRDWLDPKVLTNLTVVVTDLCSSRTFHGVLSTISSFFSWEGII